MITAEEFLDSRYPEFNHLDSGNIWVNIENLMIDFAKLHTEQAILKAATYAESYKAEQSILNAYPLELIK